MKRNTLLVLMVVFALFLSACATTQGRSISQAETREVNAGALGHPFRLAAFAMHPAGVVVDYVAFRPLMTFFSLFPWLFGYTPQDAEWYARHVGDP